MAKNIILSKKPLHLPIRPLKISRNSIAYSGIETTFKYCKYIFLNDFLNGEDKNRTVTNK